MKIKNNTKQGFVEIHKGGGYSTMQDKDQIQGEVE